MTKILFVSPTGTFDNGAEISIFNLMKYLAKEGHDIYNVVPQQFRPEQGDYFNECKKYNIYAHFIPALKWWWEDAPGGKAGTESQRAVYYRENIKEIRRFIEEKNIELVITNTVNMFQGAVAAACENIPHFWLIHEFPTGEFSYYRSKINFIDENSDEVYAVVGELTASLNNLFPRKNVKSFSPYTEIKPIQLKNGKKKRIVSIGRLTPRKNQLELIKAFEKLNNSNAELLFIGNADEDYKKQCKTYISEHKIQNISFLGNRSNPWEEVTDMDICVLTSKMETFGLVYVEALLNGVPVIISDNPGFMSAYSLFEAGTIYNCNNIDQLATTIKEHYQNFEQIKKETMENVGVIKEKYQIQNVYAQVLNDLTLLKTPKDKSIKSLNNILTLNEDIGKFGKASRKVKMLFQKAVKKIKR